MATMATSDDTPAPGGWSYEEAFSRNLGLISPEEQEKLRNSRVAIGGMGGVGGIHLIAMARLGIGRFTIADPDSFDTVNFNRQYGAMIRNLGRGKAEAMADEARQINPELDLRVFSEAITPENVDDFLADADIVVDGIDFFNIEARRLIFREARNRGLWAVTAGPIGFGTAWLSFDPNGMSFDRYFDLNDRMDRLDQLVAFAVGITPKAPHLKYTDLSRVNPNTGAAPSVGLACHLASGALATEVHKILLNHTPIYAVPYTCQFDARRYKLLKVRLRCGNRHLWQRVKRHVLKKRMKALQER